MRALVLTVNRLAWFVPTLLGLLAITFTISHVIPADPIAFIAGDNATAEQIAALKAKFGVDKPVPVQLWNYILGSPRAISASASTPSARSSTISSGVSRRPSSWHSCPSCCPP